MTLSYSLSLADKAGPPMKAHTWDTAEISAEKEKMEIEKGKRVRVEEKGK